MTSTNPIEAKMAYREKSDGRNTHETSRSTHDRRCLARSAYSREMNPIMAAAITADPMMLPTVLSLRQNRRATMSPAIVGTTIANAIGHQGMYSVVSAITGV